MNLNLTGFMVSSSWQSRRTKWWFIIFTDWHLVGIKLKSSLCLWTQVAVDPSLCCSGLSWLGCMQPLLTSRLSLQRSGTWKIEWPMSRTPTSPLGSLIRYVFINMNISCNWFSLLRLVLMFKWLGCCTDWRFTITQQRFISQRFLLDHLLLWLTLSRNNRLDFVQAIFEPTNDPWLIRRCVLWSIT